MKNFTVLKMKMNQSSPNGWLRTLLKVKSITYLLSLHLRQMRKAKSMHFLLQKRSPTPAGNCWLISLRKTWSRSIWLNPREITNLLTWINTLWPTRWEVVHLREERLCPFSTLWRKTRTEVLGRRDLALLEPNQVSTLPALELLLWCLLKITMTRPLKNRKQDSKVCTRNQAKERALMALIKTVLLTQAAPILLAVLMSHRIQIKRERSRTSRRKRQRIKRLKLSTTNERTLPHSNFILSTLLQSLL